MKKVLVLGGSHRDIPLIKAAKELGFFVATLGDRDYYLGHKYADKSYKIDFNDLEKIEDIVKKEKIDFLIPGSGEESYLKAVELSRKLKIGNFDDLKTAKLVHNKWKFKQLCLENNISTPNGFYYSKNSNFDELNFPIVVKPTNLSGGRGVEVVCNIDELKESLKNAKNIADEIFLEEYIEGELIAYSVFIKNQKILYGFTGKDDTFKNKYLITSAYPIKLENVVLTKLQNDIEKISHILSLVDGMFHLQIIIKNNIPYIIDVTRRIPGDFYPDLIEYCDNIAYSKAVVKSYIGNEITDEFNRGDNQNFVIRHCVMSDKNGIYKEVIVDKRLESKIIYRFDLLKENSEIVNFLNTQIAIIFIKLDSYNIDIVKNINNLIYPKIDEK